MGEEKNVRIDKFLWAVRIYKTRSLAANACKNNRILINDLPVKSSRVVNVGDKIMVKKNPVIYIYQIKQLLSNRVGAKLVEDYIDNLTTEKELQKLDMNSQVVYMRRDRGTGRPTKKDRRDIDKMNL